MKTTHLIALTATIVACTAATASARPAIEAPGSQASKPAPVTAGSMAAHREQVRNEQWQRSQAQPAPAPLTDRTATDDGLPLGLVLIGVTVPLAVLIVAISKPALSDRRHRRHPRSVA
jgi:hypothetical protein